MLRQQFQIWAHLNLKTGNRKRSRSLNGYARLRLRAVGRRRRKRRRKALSSGGCVISENETSCQACTDLFAWYLYRLMVRNSYLIPRIWARILTKASGSCCA